MSLGLILVILLVIFLLGGFSGRFGGYGYGYGHGGVGLIGTILIIIVILMVRLLGIAYLVPAFGVAATVPGEQGYQSVLSQLLAAITGKGGFYWTSIVLILVILSLSANTAITVVVVLVAKFTEGAWITLV